MEFNVHGGDIFTEGKLKGIKLLDFSSNINPLGVPNSFKENIQEAIDNLTLYPDILYRELIQNLKAYSGEKFSSLYFLPGNGASEIISGVISLFKNVLIVIPSFSEYEENASKYGENIIFSNLNKDMEIDYIDILAKFKEAEALIIGNPNNPTGNIIDKGKFKKILEYGEKNNKKIIIDEAFIEFTGNEKNSFIEEALSYKCLFIIRALTKFFAMPGIRFGYGITKNEEIFKGVKKYQNPWSVNSFAEIAVKYVLKDKDYIEKSKKWIEEEKKFMEEELGKIDIFERVFKTNTNYILCKLKEIKGETLYKTCLSKGILIRRASNFRGLDDYFVRFAIKSRIDNTLLLEVLKDEKYNNIIK